MQNINENAKFAKRYLETNGYKLVLRSEEERDRNFEKMLDDLCRDAMSIRRKNRDISQKTLSMRFGEDN